MLKVILQVEAEDDNPFSETDATTTEPSVFRMSGFEDKLFRTTPFEDKRTPILGTSFRSGGADGSSRPRSVSFREDEVTAPRLARVDFDAPRAPRGTPVPPISAPVTPRRAAFAKGDRINRYELGDKLGQGAFGHVYTARDTNLDRTLALKFLNPEHTANVELLQRFLQEARAAARIAHPAIVTVFEFGTVADTGTTADGTTFIAMELLAGESVTARLERSGRFAPTTAMEITRQIASALYAAHGAGIIHRDLKPDNLHFVPDPAAATGERIKILDFGLAKLKQLASVHTQATTIFGTPSYMSPEQWRSASKLDHRSDIYSLGCILFELLTGRPPFVGSMRDLILHHQQTPAPSVRGINPDITFELDGLLQRMLAKDPDNRPQSMAEVQRVLETIGALIPGAPATMPPRAALPMPAPRPRRKRSAVPRALWMLGAVALVAASIYFGRASEAASASTVTIVQSPQDTPAATP